MLEPSSVEDVLSISLLQVAASSKFTEGVGKLIAVVCVVYWLVKGESHKALPSSMGSASRYTTFILPSWGLPLSVVFNNTALIYLGAGLNSIVATLSPVTTAALANLMGRKVAKFAWVGVGMACVGAGVIAWGKLGHGHAGGAVAFGLLFSLASVLLRSIKVVLQDNLLNPTAYAREGSEKQPLQAAMPVDPMHVWALQGLPCVVISVIYAVATEDFFAFARALHVGTSREDESEVRCQYPSRPS
ncbi:unnamed protein product [Prorocentrum cordatum]|uniref:Sugar phosphate transporter domain-containing protein n=1 Tax=Prorocentrum cordatum TaxID=2364126 RepID=A0ABN9PAW0_9DINO|nr:unnamed protein product [Polarella glacialis]